MVDSIDKKRKSSFFFAQDEDQRKHFIYEPSQDFPEQQGPLCYAYALLRARSYVEKNPWATLARPCQKILEQINRQYRLNETYYKNNEMAFDDLVDSIFKGNINNDLVKKLNIRDSEGEAIETVDDFMDEFEHVAAFALLAGAQLNNNRAEYQTLDALVNLLEHKGPFVATGNFGSTLERLSRYVIKPQQIHISRHPMNYSGQHSILIIGCNILEEELYYIDPNFPNDILCINFEIYNENKLNYDGIVLLKEWNRSYTPLEKSEIISHHRRQPI